MAFIPPSGSQPVNAYTGAVPSRPATSVAGAGNFAPPVGVAQARPPARRTLAQNPMAKKPRGTQRRKRPGMSQQAGAPGAAAMPKSSLPGSPVGTDWATARQLGNGGYA
jgi:hypothetical protein